MKHISWILVSLLLLTSCFGGNPEISQPTTSDTVSTPTVESTPEASGEPNIVDQPEIQDGELSDLQGETGTDADTASGSATRSVEDLSSTGSSETQQDILDGFEDELDDIFNDLGV